MILLMFMKFKQCFLAMGDDLMFLRFDTGDLIAAEAKYHHRCALDFHKLKQAQTSSDKLRQVKQLKQSNCLMKEHFLN